MLHLSPALKQQSLEARGLLGVSNKDAGPNVPWGIHTAHIHLATSALLRSQANPDWGPPCPCKHPPGLSLKSKLDGPIQTGGGVLNLSEALNAQRGMAP